LVIGFSRRTLVHGVSLLGLSIYRSMGEVRGAYNILVGRSEGRRPLGRPRRRWEDNIKMDLSDAFLK
jgi:hypothetical protein